MVSKQQTQKIENNRGMSKISTLSLSTSEEYIFEALEKSAAILMLDK